MSNSAVHRGAELGKPGKLSVSDATAMGGEEESATFRGSIPSTLGCSWAGLGGGVCVNSRVSMARMVRL